MLLCCNYLPRTGNETTTTSNREQLADKENTYTMGTPNNFMVCE